MTSTASNSVTAQVSGFSHMVVGGTPPAVERGEPERSWIFEQLLVGEKDFTVVEDQDGEPNNQTGGTVEDEHDYGPLPLNLGGDETATGAVFSSETGVTYWVYAQGPEGSVLNPNSSVGNRVTLVQRQGFKKNRADARLKLHVTRVFLRAIDANGGEILYPECPTDLECGLTITSRVTFDVKAFWVNTIYSGKSIVELSGYQGHWNASSKIIVKGRQDEVWKHTDFVFDDDADDVGTKQHATYQLKQPVTIEVDLSRLDVGDSFTLLIEAVAETNNRRQRESYVAAFLRDPISTEGAEIETFGLDPVAVPYDEPPADEPPAPECTSGDEAQAGTLQFAKPAFFAPEMPTGTRQVVITRTGGTLGAVSARVRTQDGSAEAGTDYQAIDTIVYFGDGDDEPRVLEVPIAFDSEPEQDKSLTLALSDPQGCAQLGTPASATLTILDDDRPEEEPGSALDETFGSQGKTILAGFGGESGMAVQPDGKIVMVGGRFLDFVLARFNADGTLDTSFGDAGKIATDIAGGFAQERARAVAIQPDGKIVAAGETSLPSGDLVVALVRYNADGSLDTRFGDGGKVFDTPTVPGRAFDVVVLADGRIVVAGDAPVANNANDFGDFLVARYQANGTLDPSFGIGGTAVTNMSSTDLARNIVVQPDGALIVSGQPFGTDPGVRTSVARYTSDGTLDPGFNGNGKLVIGGAQVGRGLALQSDGRLLLAGSMPVANVPDDFTHFAVLRLNADGSFDESFGSGGTATTSITGRTDVAHAVVVQSDGKIVVAGEGNLVNPNFALARFNANGTLDTRFAIDGKLQVDFAGLEDRAENVALQPDGKIVAGGLATGRTAGYGLIRVNR